MRHHAFRWPLLAAFGLLLAGCRSVVETHIQADGSGELRSAVVFSASELEGFTQAAGNAGKSICDDLRSQVPQGVGAAFVEEERGGETYCTTLREFANLGELRSLYAEMPGVTVRDLKIDLGKLVLDLDVSARVPSGQGESSPLEWRVTIPGAGIEHNANRSESATLVWEIPAGETRHLRATSSLGLSVGTLGLTGAAIVLLAVAVAVGLALFLVRSGR